MPKVSIIVPVYNSSKTLVRCLSNLVHQTLQDIEIIIVNDCSTDNSLDIIMECEKQYSEKIIAIDLSENLGAGGARNVGLEYASGEYVGFVDSDDAVDVTMYEKLYLCAKDGNYDIVDSGFLKESEDRAVLLTTDSSCGDLNPDKKNKLISDMGYIVTKIFRRELWDGISFREHAILEDMETLMCVFLKADRIGNVKEILYRYYDTQSSLSKEMEPSKYHKAITEAIYAIESTVMKFDNYDEVKPSVEYVIYNILKSATVMASKYYDNNRLKELKNIHKRLITISPYDNIFISERIPKKEIKWLEDKLK